MIGCLKSEGMDKRLHSLMLLLAISMATVRSSMDGIFSNPEIMEWKQNLAVSERSGKYSILSQAALKIQQTLIFSLLRYLRYTLFSFTLQLTVSYQAKGSRYLNIVNTTNTKIHLNVQLWRRTSVAMQHIQHHIQHIQNIFTSLLMMVMKIPIGTLI